MTTLNLSHIRALTFDCYGTLIDWETGLLSVLRPWADREGLADISDDGLLAAFSLTEPRVQAEWPTARYPTILREVMRQLANHFEVTASDADCETLAESVGDWPAFADTPDAMARLKARFKLVIVSNVDRASFARTQERIGIEFDAIVTAEEVGSYKPAFGHFHRALDLLGALGVDKSQVLHVAESLYHDHVPAKALELRTAWIKRTRKGSSRATRTPESPVVPDMTFPTLDAFANAAIV
ncbi:MAG: haloacid dehalogenase type II [Phycisphaerales bacterium]|nr:haloacid dehalogenase type II [Phycisphaerales bacterium]MCB9864654.1 haloacid dehalogenase type II [Phycisphaerales bacterium]